MPFYRKTGGYHAITSVDHGIQEQDRGANVYADPADRYTYSYDAAPLEQVLPALVVRPETGEALSHAVRLCNENRIPLTVRGAGTNLSGGTVPLPGGLAIVTNGLNRIPEINAEDMYAVVEPGVVPAKFAAAAQAKGLFYFSTSTARRSKPDPAR